VKEKMVNIDEEKKEIEQLYKAIIEAEDRKDMEGFLKFMSDDVLIQSPNVPEIQGKKEVREFARDALRARVSTKGGLRKIEVSSSGDMAFVSGYYLTTTKGPEGPIEDEGKFLGVYKKIDGEWKCVAVSFSSDKPLT